MPTSESTPKTVRFGVFELDSRAGELRKHGLRLKLQNQSFQVLAALLEHPGEVVTKEELGQRLWPSGTFVDFDHGLHSAITRLREILGDSSERPRFIETLPRRGYRFIAPVEVALDMPPQTSAGIPVPGERPRRGRAAALAGWVSGSMVVIVVLGLILAGFWRPSRRETALPIRSLAVLPLQNLSGDPAQEYFADGMTDALIAELSKIKSIRVISHTSTMHYKGTNKALPDIARELSVDGVVEGSVVRSGNRVRIMAQLIQATSDEHIWAETYERDLSDILKLQGDVAESIAQQIRGRLTPQEQAKAASAPRVKPEAYEAYLRGRYFWNQRTEEGLWKSIHLFQQAMDIDPHWALPYVGLGDAYMVLDAWTVEAMSPKEVPQEARAAIAKALELDPASAEAHTVLAGLKHGDWDWKRAEAEYRRAIELNPNYDHAHQWYGQLLCEMGRMDEGVSQAVLAHNLDPLNRILGVDVGYRLYWQRRYAEAVAPIRQTLELDPNFTVGHRFLGQVYEQMGRYEEAISELRRAAELSHDNPIDLGALGHVLAISGRSALAKQILVQLQQLSVRRHVSAFEPALVYAGLGRHQQALEWLEKAFEEQSAWMLHLKVDPRLDSLRSDPRFQSLLSRVGLQ
jgi:TolB-like protein/DNA-binding winged helix-turn-helix (wHTH) protein/Tfp pilus assembly protein PilF